MEFPVILSTFGIIFLAELGDKTQLTALALATKFHWKKVFIGLAAAFTLLNLGAVIVGKLLFAILPLFWIKLVSGSLFLYFGFATLSASVNAQEGDDTEEKSLSLKGPIATAFFMILFAELGDKTQIVTASLAAQNDLPLEVFFGSTFALWLVSLIGIFLGLQITKFIPLSYIHKAAGSIFLIFGLVIIYQAFTNV